MFSLNLALFAGLLTFVALKTPGKRHSLPFWKRWGPFFGMLVASILVMVDLTRHILLDAQLFVEHLHMYNPDFSLTCAGKFGMSSTWLGNVLLLVSLVFYVLPVQTAASRVVTTSR